MSITDELRSYARAVWTEEDYGRVVHIPNGKLLAIADCIDKCHEDIIGEFRREYEDFKNCRDIDYVKLPVDADGVPIHVGDEVVEDGCGVPYKVMSMKLFDDCWDVGECGMNPNLCRHYQPDSWERIIEDAYQLDVAFGEGTEEYARTSVVRELVERCRRLAGER